MLPTKYGHGRQRLGVCRGPHTAQDGWTPLHVACQEGHQEVVQYLVSVGANVHAADKVRAWPLEQAWLCVSWTASHGESMTHRMGGRRCT